MMPSYVLVSSLLHTDSLVAWRLITLSILNELFLRLLDISGECSILLEHNSVNWEEI